MPSVSQMVSLVSLPTVSRTSPKLLSSILSNLVFNSASQQQKREPRRGRTGKTLEHINNAVGIADGVSGIVANGVA